MWEVPRCAKSQVTPTKTTAFTGGFPNFQSWRRDTSKWAISPAAVACCVFPCSEAFSSSQLILVGIVSYRCLSHSGNHESISSTDLSLPLVGTSFLWEKRSLLEYPCSSVIKIISIRTATTLEGVSEGKACSCVKLFAELQPTIISFSFRGGSASTHPSKDRPATEVLAFDDIHPPRCTKQPRLSVTERPAYPPILRLTARNPVLCLGWATNQKSKRFFYCAVHIVFSNAIRLPLNNLAQEFL